MRQQRLWIKEASQDCGEENSSLLLTCNIACKFHKGKGKGKFYKGKFHNSQQTVAQEWGRFWQETESRGPQTRFWIGTYMSLVYLATRSDNKERLD